MFRHVSDSQFRLATRRGGSSGYKLQPMNSQCLRAFLILAAFSGCTDDKPVLADSTAVSTTPSPAILPARLNPGWDTTAAGPAMLLSIPDNSAVAHVVLPFLTDSVLSTAPSFTLDSFSDLQVELLDRSGLSGSASLIVDLNQTV